MYILCMYVGLDGHVKVYSLQTMQVVHGMRFGAPLVSLAMSADNKKFLVGFVDGGLMVRTRRTDAAGSLGLGGVGSSSSSAKQQSRYYKGAGAAAELTEDGMVETERTVRLRPYEVTVTYHRTHALTTLLPPSSSIYLVTSFPPIALLVVPAGTEHLSSFRIVRYPSQVQLKKFNYQQALDSALKTRNPLVGAYHHASQCSHCFFFCTQALHTHSH
jgi:hypothetical protein